MQLNLSKEKQTKFVMPTEKDGVMIILSSPSGAGKTTLVKNYQNLKILKFLFLIQQEIQDLMKFQIKIIFLLMKMNLKD